MPEIGFKSLPTRIPVIGEFAIRGGVLPPEQAHRPGRDGNRGPGECARANSGDGHERASQRHAGGLGGRLGGGDRACHPAERARRGELLQGGGRDRVEDHVVGGEAVPVAEAGGVADLADDGGDDDRADPEQVGQSGPGRPSSLRIFAVRVTSNWTAVLAPIVLICGLRQVPPSWRRHSSAPPASGEEWPVPGVRPLLRPEAHLARGTPPGGTDTRTEYRAATGRLRTRSYVSTSTAVATGRYSSGSCQRL
jgi:hypothetical protein